MSYNDNLFNNISRPRNLEKTGFFFQDANCRKLVECFELDKSKMVDLVKLESYIGEKVLNLIILNS